ncbi:hypothetical protein SARC_06194 [Sphaeroforma arctica JP610]|uniref:Uncharacterized protein n=1 Tax=Sphaeroforma arctica JP610 TaxID=667725 RepID=A0A0L0FXB3_9EUKA|nr:hypothetical protein SARC_06194 [Sphaeroforma arctica JP610]KNC81485.1 hypothetical protein SARC_06194 [Sphaeroforma arctica JP610]|eukprot:XP_014155387.1 hypothetical protein SARC_06194 [Sphaeroforma arctica JP610]
MVRFSASKVLRGAICAVAIYYAYVVWSRGVTSPTTPSADSESFDAVEADDHIRDQPNERVQLDQGDANHRRSGTANSTTQHKRMERAASWQPPTAEELQTGLTAMRQNLKIFVYDIESYTDNTGRHPLDIQSTQCGIATGNNKGYGVERYFVEMLKRSSYVATDATEANLFMIPVLPCAAKWEHTNKKLSKQQNHEKGKRFSMDYVTAAVTFVSTTWPYLSGGRPQLTAAQKSSVPFGADHFWFSTHDGGATRAWEAPHDFVNNSIALVNTADEVMAYKPCWDVSLPCNCDFDRPPKPSEHDVL